VILNRSGFKYSNVIATLFQSEAVTEMEKGLCARLTTKTTPRVVPLEDPYPAISAKHRHGHETIIGVRHPIRE